MKWCSVTFAAVMFADCVVLWAAAVNFGQFVDDAAAAVTVWIRMMWLNCLLLLHRLLWH